MGFRVIFGGRRLSALARLVKAGGNRINSNRRPNRRKDVSEI